MSLFVPEIIGQDVPIPRSGHSAVFYNGAMIVFGGFGRMTELDNGQEFYQDPKDIWVYNIALSYWNILETTGDGPKWGLSGAHACVFKGSLILHAGFEDNLENHARRTNKVHQLDLETHHWRHLSKEGGIQGPAPPKCDKLGGWAHNDQVIYFGGYGSPTTADNGVNGEFKFERGQGWNSVVSVLDFTNPKKLKWTYPNVTGDRPSPRAAHACTKIGNKGFVFGGRSGDGRLNDMYCLNLDTFEWRKVPYDMTEAPSGRSWHTLNWLSNTSMLVYAGLDNNSDPLADMWKFDITTSKWHEMKDVREKLGVYSPRMWHTSVNSEEGEVVIFGGSTNSYIKEDQGNHCDRIVILKTTASSLKHLCTQKVTKCWSFLHSRKHELPSSIVEMIENILFNRKS